MKTPRQLYSKRLKKSKASKYTRMFECEFFVTQYFGYTAFAKNNYKSGYHEGLDGVPIDKTSFNLYTPMDGVVKHVGHCKDYGINVIVFNKKTGLSLRFCHLKMALVREGQRVRAGVSKVGVIGNTGNSKGIHLHLNCVPMLQYGVKAFPTNGTNGRVDPIAVLRQLGVHI